MSIKVAVYGSLRSGEGNHRLLEASTFLGYDTTEAVMRDLGAFPSISLTQENPVPVVIEVYEVDYSTFHRLDSLEGYPTFYNRSEISTKYGLAWIYHIEEPDEYNRSLVSGGDWVKHLKEKREHRYAKAR